MNDLDGDDDEVVVMDATEEDIRLSIERAVERSGFTRDELKAQAEKGWFKTFNAQLAWRAVRDFSDWQPTIDRGADLGSQPSRTGHR